MSALTLGNVTRNSVLTLLRITYPSCVNTVNRHLKHEKRISPNNGSVPRLIHTTPIRNGLDEFFDKKENWTEKEVKVGRPWKPDELRLKSNGDLHKLWYVLLKERNMLMTMEEEYNRLHELMPSPERMFKVEESMENILDVVAERDRAYNLLEHGETGESGTRPSIDILGRDFTRRNQEHYIPYEMSHHPEVERKWKWQEKYLRLAEEKQIRIDDARRFAKERKNKELKELFPNAEID